MLKPIIVGSLLCALATGIVLYITQKTAAADTLTLGTMSGWPPFVSINGDGDYEGFRWQNGKWVHIEKVFEEQQLKDGQAPMPKPFLDKDGNPIDDKE